MFQLTNTNKPRNWIILNYGFPFSWVSFQSSQKSLIYTTHCIYISVQNRCFVSELMLLYIRHPYFLLAITEIKQIWRAFIVTKDKQPAQLIYTWTGVHEHQTQYPLRSALAMDLLSAPSSEAYVDCCDYRRLARGTEWRKNL